MSDTFDWTQEDKAIRGRYLEQEDREIMRIKDMVTGETRQVPNIKHDADAVAYATGEPAIRTFSTGATRNRAEGKHDFHGYLSPIALRRFAEYMTKHRLQADGTVRASDNWKKGIPKQEYLSSAMRHLFDVWLLHDGFPGIYTQDIEEALAALLFNVQGYLHEELKEKGTDALPQYDFDSMQIGGTK